MIRVLDLAVTAAARTHTAAGDCCERAALACEWAAGWLRWIAAVCRATP